MSPAGVRDQWEGVKGGNESSTMLRVPIRVDHDSPPLPAPCVTFRRFVVSLRGPGQSPVLPFACCVGSLLSVGRCGRCSCWSRFRVSGAQSLVCQGCAGCGRVCRLCISSAQKLAYRSCAGCCRGRLTVFAAHAPPAPSGHPQPASLRSHVREAQVPHSSARCTPTLRPE